MKTDQPTGDIAFTVSYVTWYPLQSYVRNNAFVSISVISLTFIMPLP